MTLTLKNNAPDGEAKRIKRSAFRWNTAAGVLFALQSTIMLIVLTRVCDVFVAGTFTIAFANASLFMQVGNFGIRKFQASDRAFVFSFREYFASRVFTCLLMVVSSGVYVTYLTVANDYSAYKALVMFIMCVWRAVDSFEEIYVAAYQLQDRLDVGARMCTIRLAIVCAAFMGAVIVTQDLLASLLIDTAVSGAIFVLQIRYVRNRYHLPKLGKLSGWRKVRKLLWDCLPLFIADFLLYYVSNAPKFAIDSTMDDAAQAYYGYLSMPVFVVTLLAGFIYNPMITSMTDSWNGRDIKALVASFLKLIGAIVVITIVCIAGAWLLGIPVLDALYNADLAPYQPELLILVAGGGFLAVTELAVLGITIIRFQRILVPLYAALTIMAFFGCRFAVGTWGLTGAAWAYTFMMAAGAIMFAATMAFGMRLLRNDRT